MARKVADKENIKILEALYDGGVKPDMKELAKKTGMSPYTIRKRIEFLENHNVIRNFIPNLNPAQLGLRLLLFAFYKVDFSNGKFEKEVIPAINKDPNFISFGKLVGGGGTYNFYTVQLFRDLHDYNTSIDKFYNERFPFLHELVKDKTVFFVPVTKDSKILELDKLLRYLKESVAETD